MKLLKKCEHFGFCSQVGSEGCPMQSFQSDLCFAYHGPSPNHLAMQRTTFSIKTLSILHPERHLQEIPTYKLRDIMEKCDDILRKKCFPNGSKWCDWVIERLLLILWQCENSCENTVTNIDLCLMFVLFSFLGSYFLSTESSPRGRQLYR